jgi:hypothetical protein
MTARKPSDPKVGDGAGLFRHLGRQMGAQLGLELDRVVVAAPNRELDLPQAQATIAQRLRYAPCQTCLVHAIHSPVSCRVRARNR